jgi:hypothetical protein
MKILSSAKLLSSIILLFAVGVISDGQTKARDDVPPYELTAMKVAPYNQRTNSFLAEVSPGDKTGFWNALNLSLLVSIEVSGKRGSYISRRQVEVTAFEGNKLILKRMAELGVLDDESGKYYVPVWLYGSFCQPVVVKARLVGQQRISTVQRRIDFNCGE